MKLKIQQKNFVGPTKHFVSCISNKLFCCDNQIFVGTNKLFSQCIKNLVDKFESTGSVHNIPTTTRVQVENNPNSQQLGLSASTTWRILRKDLDLVQLVQELKLDDHSLRQQFADFIFEQGDRFSGKIIFSDFKIDEINFVMRLLPDKIMFIQTE